MGRLLIATVLAMTAPFAGGACAATLDDMRTSGALRIAYREDAPPFSYKAATGTPRASWSSSAVPWHRGSAESLGLPSSRSSTFR